MRNIIRGRGLPGIVVGIIALVVIAAGGAYAATSGSGAIKACAKKHGGALYVAKKCKKGDTKLSWNQTGPAGAPGTPGTGGAAGVAGAAGATGPAGATGAAGVTGVTGKNGSNGTTGATGATGNAGANGTVSALITPALSGDVDFSGAGNLSPQSVTTLTLPAGDFAISANANLDVDLPVSMKYGINCTLADGSATDTVYASGPTTSTGGADASLAFNLGVTGTAGSQVKLTCEQTGFTEPSDGTVITSAVISAVQASTVTTTN